MARKLIILILLIGCSLSLFAQMQKEILIEQTHHYLTDINAPQSISAEYIVDKCLTENFDIVFLLAQGTIETGMGKYGIGKCKKSIFGISGKGYQTYNSAIDSYICLIKKRYLVNNNWEALMNDFVNHRGVRYAENIHYEWHMRAQYDYIQKNYFKQD